jgi:hypothetical protein
MCRERRGTRRQARGTDISGRDTGRARRGSDGHARGNDSLARGTDISGRGRGRARRDSDNFGRGGDRRRGRRQDCRRRTETEALALRLCIVFLAFFFGREIW